MKKLVVVLMVCIALSTGSTGNYVQGDGGAVEFSPFGHDDIVRK